MIWIVQLLCPQRHCIIAAAYDPERSNAEESIKKLEDVRHSLKCNPWCGICGSTSLQYEAAETVFQTMEEAMPHLALNQLKQIITGEMLSRLPKLN